MTSPHADHPPLVVRTTLIDDPGPLLSLLPSDQQPLVWLRDGDGMVAWGEAARIEPVDVGGVAQGSTRFDRALDWWQDLCSRAVIRDQARVPGSGLVAFASFAFANGPDPDRPHSDRPSSVMIVPEVVFGRRDGTCWVTTIGTTLRPAPAVTGAPRPRSTVAVRCSDDDVSREHFRRAVSQTVEAIGRGAARKVVLARAVTVTTDDEVDPRAVLRSLSESYRSCWTFHVDGFLGATPELLTRRFGGLITSRVLAGTIGRGSDAAEDQQLAAELTNSAKDQQEHRFAVESVVEALGPLCSAINVPESPFVLQLPNVMHLATDVTGVTRDDSPSLRVAAALHPSAAVGGTPTSAAVEILTRVEAAARGRYAGPVGWMDATGDGEWGIGLRSAMVGADRRSLRLYAGAGIVADSDPSAELAETDVKLLPLLDALGVPRRVVHEAG